MSEPNPYAAPSARVDDVPVADAEAELATRWQRFVAAFIDNLLFMGAAVIGGIAASMRENPLLAGVLALAALATLIALIWINIVLLRRHGQSIGKRQIKIRVLRSSGERATLGRLVLLRGLPQWLVGGIGNLVPIVNVLALIDALFIFGRSRRCVHDYIADTIVVQTV